VNGIHVFRGRVQWPTALNSIFNHWVLWGIARNLVLLRAAYFIRLFLGDHMIYILFTSIDNHFLSSQGCHLHLNKESKLSPRVFRTVPNAENRLCHSFWNWSLGFVTKIIIYYLFCQLGSGVACCCLHVWFRMLKYKQNIYIYIYIYIITLTTDTLKPNFYNHVTTYNNVKECRVKENRNRLRTAHRVSGGIAHLFLNLGTRRRFVVSITPRPLYRRERPGSHCTGSWVAPGSRRV
jgi:hypothetical protein